jgi:hypothetical protein
MEACAEVLMTPDDLAARRPRASDGLTATGLIGIGTASTGSFGKVACRRLHAFQRWNAPEMSGH